jgi:uncharacterized protein YaaN involved in tellurite resistance
MSLQLQTTKPLEDVKIEMGALQNAESAGQLTPLKKAQAVSKARSINIQDRIAASEYGDEVHDQMAQFNTNVLAKAKNRDVEEVGKMVTAVVSHAKRLDMGLLNQKPGFFDRMFGKAVDGVTAFTAQFESIEDQIDTVTKELVTWRQKVVDRAVELDQMYAINLNQFVELGLLIEAGKERLRIANEEELPAKQAEVSAETDPTISMQKSQELSDLQDAIARFDKKVYDLELLRQSCITTAAQIRLIQANALTLAENIKTTIRSTIPEWKKQFVIALALDEQKKASDLDNMVRDMNNALMVKNAELLKQNAVNVARQNQRGVIDLVTLQKVQSEFIATLDAVEVEATKGAQEREAGRKELERMEAEMKARMTRKKVA